MFDAIKSLIGCKRRRCWHEETIKKKPRISHGCPICKETVVGAVVTACGHTFCEECLTNYQLYKEVTSRQECPVCRAKFQRNPYYKCFDLDYIIEQYLDPEALSDFKQRRKQYENWQKLRSLDKVEVGMKVDCKDTEDIWCPAAIKLIIDHGDQAPLLLIHYDGWHTMYDELLPKNSPRLAPRGFYTERSKVNLDIPRYQLVNRDGNTQAILLSQNSVPPTN